MNTNYSSPKTNIFAALLILRSALAYGMNVRLVKARNEDCASPIKENYVDEDFRNYEFSNGHLATREDILAETHTSDFEKYLSLNYKACYGTPEAMEKYYKTGLLSLDNFKGIGKCHLVNINDMIYFFNAINDKDRAEIFKQQYFTEAGQQQKHFYDFFRYMHGSPWAIKNFKRKLWVVETLDKNMPKAKQPVVISIMNAVLSPIYFIMKYIPRRSVLRMPKYKCVTYRIGDVTNGFAVEFHIPKKFGFE